VDSKFRVASERWAALILFLIYDIFQIWFVGHIEVKSNSESLLTYDFNWIEEFHLNTLTIIALFFIPIIISYFVGVRSVTRSDMVQIIGPDSLLNRVKMEFHLGNPDKIEYSIENVDHFLEDLAVGEPEGTYQNLKMLFGIGVMVENLIEKTGVKSIKRVYMSNELVPNAFTMRILPIPKLGQDWIIINRNIIDILNDDEIKAVVAHEIGHAARKDSWINSALYSPRLIIIVAWAVLLAAMGEILLDEPFNQITLIRIFLIFTLMFIIRIVMNFAYRLITFAYRRTELLADHYAAKVMGELKLINALFKIGKRAEVVRILKSDVEYLNTKYNELNENEMSVRLLNMIDPSEIDINRAREFSIEYFVRSKLNSIYRGFRLDIDDKEFNQLVERSKDNLYIDLTNYLDKKKNKSILEKNDININFDEDLDKDDLHNLIKNLEETDNLIFETERLEKEGVLPETKTHPLVSERLKFLYNCFN